MTETRTNSPEKIDNTQALELALLVDLEARWENLRTFAWQPSQPQDTPPNDQNLLEKQKAYDAFRVKLASYNKLYQPAHVPELLLNTPVRLGIWSGRMRKLYVRIEHVPEGHCPVHLVEKAYRWADRMADRMGKTRISRYAPPGTIGEAIRSLEALSQWCESQSQG